MIKTVPYIETLGNEKFKEFLNKSFSIDMLWDNNEMIDMIFDGWRGKNMINWFKFTNEKGNVLEFYPEYFVIKVGANSNKLPLPLTINEFINDMLLYKIELYWTDWIDLNFEPKDYLNKSEIKNYYINILKKMDKSHELL